MTHSENKSSDEKKTPALIAYHVPEREKAPWTRIGAGWDHKDESPWVYWRVKLSKDGPYDTEKTYPDLHG